jgi:hypothetical protein
MFCEYTELVKIMDKINFAFCGGINARVTGKFRHDSSCGLPAVPVGELCGVALLLIWDTYCAACPLVQHFIISFCL